MAYYSVILHNISILCYINIYYYYIKYLKYCIISAILHNMQYALTESLSHRKYFREHSLYNSVQELLFDPQRFGCVLGGG